MPVFKTNEAAIEAVAKTVPAKATQTKEEIPTTDLRYLAARRAWDERYGDLITRARNWRASSWLQSAALIVIGGCLYAQIQKEQFHVFMVATDPTTGRVIASGAAEQSATVDDIQKEAALADWLYDFRMVSSSGISQNRAVNRVFDLIANSSEAHKKIKAFYVPDLGGTDVFERGRHEEVDVSVQSVLPNGIPNTFAAEWIETTTATPGGELISRKHWRGAFTIILSQPKDLAAAKKNPLGIYVKEAHWTLVADEKK
jgi:type IV secretory pathway TrbF-like protein